MKILCLYNNDIAIELFEWLKSKTHETVLWSERLEENWCREQGFDLTVSYTYRFIIPQEILSALNNNVVNLHNSLLPWNRGASPNMWSIVEGSPRGVTLHYMDEQLDKGYVIAQEIVDDCKDDSETLASSYNNLDMAAKSLFKKAFKYYEYWPSLRKKCLGQGSYHSVKDGEKLDKTVESYDISVEKLRRLSAFNYCGNSKSDR